MRKIILWIGIFLLLVSCVSAFGYNPRLYWKFDHNLDEAIHGFDMEGDWSENTTQGVGGKSINLSEGVPHKVVNVSVNSSLLSPEKGVVRCS